MKILLIIAISQIARFSQSLQNTNCDKNYAQIKSIQRGHYRDVQEDVQFSAIASYFNGALLSSIKENIQSPSKNIDCSPLRNLNYLYVTGIMGHLANFIGGSIIVEFRQTYEINKIRFWMMDDYNRIYYIQIFATGADRKTESLLYQGQVSFGVWNKNLYIRNYNFSYFQNLINSKKLFAIVGKTVNTFKFKDQLISKLRFYNQNGNSINSFMSIIRIEAFYAL